MESETPLPAYSAPLDQLPQYEPSINFQGMALIKTEFITPYQANTGTRAWKPVILQMNSTQLQIYNINVDKKLQDIIVNLYFELNSLNQLTIDLNAEYKKNNNGVDFDFHRNSADAEYLDDLFSGDAYGSGGPVDGCKSIFNESKFSKLCNKIKTQKTQKTMAHIKDYYHILKDNQLLFEPSLNAGTTATATATAKNFDKYKGQLLHCYSLANLHVGEAPSLNQLISAMYKEDQSSSPSNNSSLVKYKNTLRLRIEYKQILLQFWSFHAMVSWFRSLMIGKDLSQPLESRTVTKLKSIPSRFSSRNNALLAATAAAASYGQRNRSSGGSRSRNRSRSRGNISSEVVEEPTEIEDVYSNPTNQYLAHKEDNTNMNNNNNNNNASSAESTHSSVFERESRSSSSSITSSSASSSSSLFSTSDSSDIGLVTIHNYKFVSKDNVYTTVEKQYISNCLPDLNSFDKWSGKLVTISNADHFIRDERSYKNKNDVFISYSALGDLVNLYDKKFQQLESNSLGLHAKNSGKLCTTRTFLIHQDGLVAVA